MATQWLRRAWMAAAGASVVLLAACGGGDIVSALTPERFIAFGDGMADLGQNASGRRYTVNDGSENNWTLSVAQRFSRSLDVARNGGLSYAHGNARVVATPGAGNDATAVPVSAQIDAFLAANTFRPADVVLVNAGHSDIIVQGRAVIDGALTAEQARTAVGEAGTELGKQVRRLVDAGAKQVVIAGAYNLGRSPWAKQTGQEALLEQLSSEFNIRLKVEIASLGDAGTVLYVDVPNQLNLYEAHPANYSLSNSSESVCNSVDAGEGIGTGTNQVDSSDCFTSTVVNGDYNSYMFADRVYVTPHVHRRIGEFVADRIRDRW